MAIFTEFYSFLLSYASTLNFEECCTWILKICMAVYFIVFYNLTRDRPTLFKVFIVCCFVIIVLLCYLPDRRTLPIMVIFISICWLAFMVWSFVSYWYSSRKLKKNKQMVSSKFDLSARFEYPENGRMRPMIISKSFYVTFCTPVIFSVSHYNTFIKVELSAFTMVTYILI